MFNLNPRENKFFDMFIESAEYIDKSAKMLCDYINDLRNAEENYKKIQSLEHECDRHVHHILEELNKTFITPIDREDIFSIARSMDDIIDFIEDTASRFIMFNLTNKSNESVSFSNLISECTQKIIIVMKEFKIMSKSKKLPEVIIDINRIENEGDNLYRHTIHNLFNSKIDTLDVIKWKEIYESMENSLDACEDVANLVEGVVMKHA